MLHISYEAHDNSSSLSATQASQKFGHPWLKCSCMFFVLLSLLAFFCCIIVCFLAATASSETEFSIVLSVVDLARFTPKTESEGQFAAYGACQDCS